MYTPKEVFKKVKCKECNLKNSCYFVKQREEYMCNEYAYYLEEQNKLLLDAFIDLLEDAKSLYVHYPNNFRKSKDEYFEKENKIIEQVTNKKIEEIK